MLEVLAYLQNAWAALSLLSMLGSVMGLALVVVALCVLPSALRRTAVGVGLALLVLSSTYQVAHVAGADRARAVAEKRAADAELKRAQIAERQNRDDAQRAARDLAQTQADNAKLKELLDEARKDRDAGRVCVDGDTARRLRNL